MDGAILVFNAGSSSLKFSGYALEGKGPAELFSGLMEQRGGRLTAKDAAGKRVLDEPAPKENTETVSRVLAWSQGFFQGRELKAVGHRIVHGGPAFSGPVRVDGEVVKKLQGLSPLAPLHQGYNLEPIGVVMRERPGVAQVACFDTGFHATQDELARAVALPEEYVKQGITRYGFHGLSYEYIAGRFAELDAAASQERVIAAHLGSGASLCAIKGGRSVATTMGFSTLDGLMMGTRAGAMDPGVILYMLSTLNMPVKAVEDVLYHKAGLLGVSGISGDVRTLLASDSAKAREAIDLFVYRIGREMGSMAAAMGGVDHLVFTGGIGENSGVIRSRVSGLARWLGAELDEKANGAKEGVEGRLSLDKSRVGVWVIPTNEALMIARHTVRMVGG